MSDRNLKEADLKKVQGGTNTDPEQNPDYEKGDESIGTAPEPKRD